MMTMVTEVCGVKGVYGDLCLQPKLVRELLNEEGSLELWLKFAGVDLQIRFRAEQEQDVYTKVRSVTLDGERMDGNVIPRSVLQAVKAEREIIVSI